MTAPSDKELRAIERNTLNNEAGRAMARELRAARKVVREARRFVASSDGFREFTATQEALAAYDKARKGKVTT